MPQPDHHDHDRRNGAAIIIHVHLEPTAQTDNIRVTTIARGGTLPLDGAARADTLRRVRAAIDAELGDTRQPEPARQRNEHLDALVAVIAALVRHALRSGDVAAGDHAILVNALQPASDWGD